MRIVAPENPQSKHESSALTLTKDPVKCIHLTSSASSRAVSTRRPSKYTISASFSSVVIMAGVNSWGSNPGNPGVWMHVRVFLQCHAEQSVSIPEYIRDILTCRWFFKTCKCSNLVWVLLFKCSNNIAVYTDPKSSLHGFIHWKKGFADSI